MADIAVRSLTKQFGRVRAVDDVTFDVRPGLITGFLGPNGAGKTTALRAMLGLVTPTSGEVLIAGQPYARLANPRRVVGALLEASGFHSGRRGRDHLRVLAGIAQVGSTRVDEVLAMVRLDRDADRRVGEYSLGMRQRLGLASALLGDPEVLVLDEPANGLDPAGVAWLRGLLRDLAAQGRAVVVSSHALAEVAQTVDRVVVIHEGRLRFDGRLDELGGSAGALESAFLELTASTMAGGGAR